MANYDLQKVLAAADGRWNKIVSRLARTSFDPKTTKRFGLHGSCPKHGGTDGFRFFPDFQKTGGGVCNTCGTFATGISLLAWLNDLPMNLVINDIAEYLAIEPEQQRFRPSHAYPSRASGKGWAKAPKTKEAFIPERKIIDPAVVAEQRQRLNEIWKASVPLSNEKAKPARLYFDSRGVNSSKYEDNPFLRFHPNLDYWDTETGEIIGCFPALVMMFINQDGTPTNLHRIYLTMQGDKAHVTGDAKKMTKKPDDTTLSGSAIWLSPPRSVIGIAEGVETGIAVQAGTGLSVAACGNAVLLERFMPPKEVKVIHNFVDKDRSGRGEEAAATFRERMAIARPDIQVIEHLPPLDIPSGAKSVDWLDVWNEYGKAGFRNVTMITNLQNAG